MLPIIVKYAVCPGGCSISVRLLASGEVATDRVRDFCLYKDLEIEVEDGERRMSQYASRFMIDRYDRVFVSGGGVLVWDLPGTADVRMSARAKNLRAPANAFESFSFAFDSLPQASRFFSRHTCSGCTLVGVSDAAYIVESGDIHSILMHAGARPAAYPLEHADRLSLHTTAGITGELPRCTSLSFSGDERDLDLTLFPRLEQLYTAGRLDVSTIPPSVSHLQMKSAVQMARIVEAVKAGAIHVSSITCALSRPERARAERLICTPTPATYPILLNPHCGSAHNARMRRVRRGWTLRTAARARGAPWMRDLTACVLRAARAGVPAPVADALLALFECS